LTKTGLLAGYTREVS